eukprot:TRINITY_DN46884_c0_g1_i1.p1 TRINITY_DN46884_c0_g1~~TRINITY_DN46884_c0_g1_i1.p1  ORF type:complete len:337 (+),score=70.69 TRINITY_DN46884_c0_g1_i1:68-1012(+)
MTTKPQMLAAAIAALHLLACYSAKLSVGSNSTNQIPKIFHQLAPADKSHWPDAWFVCQESWKNVYPDWEYKLWNDQDVDQLVAARYPKERDWFFAMPMNIERVDAARSFILHAYGGLYADMDFYCYKKLELPEDGKAVLVASNAGEEIVQNSLMASPKGHPFWELTFKMMANFQKEHPTKPTDEKQVGPYVIEATGPNMLKRALQTQEGHGMIDKLDRLKYNPGMVESPQCTPQTCFTRHLYTGCWAVGRKCSGWQRDFVDERKLNQAARTAKDIHALLLTEVGSEADEHQELYQALGPHLAVWQKHFDSQKQD